MPTLLLVVVALAGCAEDSAGPKVTRPTQKASDDPIVTLLSSTPWHGSVTGFDKGPITPQKGFTLCFTACGSNSRYFSAQKDADKLEINVTWTKAEYGTDTLFVRLNKWARGDRSWQIEEIASFEGKSPLSWNRTGLDVGATILLEVLPPRDSGLVYDQGFDVTVKWYKIQ